MWSEGATKIPEEKRTTSLRTGALHCTALHCTALLPTCELVGFSWLSTGPTKAYTLLSECLNLDCLTLTILKYDCLTRPSKWLLHVCNV